VNVDPEFVTIMLRVVLVGGTIVIIGATGLFFAFRAFAPTEKKGRGDFRAVVAVIAVLAVVMVGCVVLFIFSFSKR
jgi:hypothetical protein